MARLRALARCMTLPRTTTLTAAKSSLWCASTQRISDTQKLIYIDSVQTDLKRFTDVKSTSTYLLNSGADGKSHKVVPLSAVP